MAFSYRNEPQELDARRHAAEDVANDIVCYLSAKCRRRDVSKALGDEITGLKLVLDPGRGELPTDGHKAVMAFWRMRSGENGMPEDGALDVNDLGAARDYCKLIDISPDNDEFFYREVGRRLSDGGDMADSNIFDFKERSAANTFETACYLTSRQLGRTLLSEYDAIPGAKASRSHRLILPVGNGEITQLLVCDLPLGA